MDPPKAQWEILAAGKLQSLLEAIPKEWIIPQEIIDQFDKRDSLIDIPHESKVFTSEELEYTDSSATVLVQKLCSGKWSSEAITRAFCKRAAIAHQLVRMASTNSQ
jgi:amidase